MTSRSDPHQFSGGSPPRSVSKHIVDEEQKTLSKQYEMMQHIDDRALRITRTSAVLLGITFTGLSLLIRLNSSATKLLIPDISFRASVFGIAGLLCLTLSLIVGIVTTQYSRPIYGVGERIRHGISARRSESTALSDLSAEYDDAIAAMQSRLERNRRLLWGVQILFISGLLLLLAASILVVSEAVKVGADQSLQPSLLYAMPS